jgi:hypothetical protein
VETNGHPKVRIGNYEYVVVPQKVGRIKRKLRAILGDLGEEGSLEENTSFVDVLSSRGYEILKALIPDLMPKHEFEGYRSEQAMIEDDYAEEFDHSPTFAEIVNAFEVAMKVSRYDIFKSLGKLISSDLISAVVNQAAADLAIRSLPSSSATSTGTTSTTSGTTPETPEVVDGSATEVASAPSQPENAA